MPDTIWLHLIKALANDKTHKLFEIFLLTFKMTKTQQINQKGEDFLKILPARYLKVTNAIANLLIAY